MKMIGIERISDEAIQASVKKLQEGAVSKGACIRELFAGGLDVKEIASVTGIRYNHVYNVVRNEVLKNNLEVEMGRRNSKDSKKAKILALLEEGKTITEVSRELQIMYNYVWQVAKQGGYTGKKDQKAQAEDKADPKAEAKTTDTKKTRKTSKAKTVVA